MNWRTTSIIENKERLVINEKSKRKYKSATEEGFLTDIWKGEGTLQEKYNLWTEEVEKIAKQNFVTAKKRKRPANRTLRKLRQRKRELKTEKGKAEYAMNTARRKVIQQLIDEELVLQEKNRVSRVAQTIKKEKGFDGNAFWELTKRLGGRKTEIATAMFDEKGNLEEEPEKIKEIYKEFYEKLLKDRDRENEEEREVQQLKEKCIEVMRDSATKKEIKEITTEEYDRMKKKLKKKKAPDQEGWRYEWVANAGNDLDQSIQMMMNESRKQKWQPEQWRNMRIKAITKTATKRMDMNFKRGLFQTNILSKCTERIFLNRNKGTVDESMQPFQNGGVNERSISDILFMINNTAAEFKEKKKDLYILFGDLEKCFDKLYLKDCIIELVEAGMPLEEAMYIYEMNRNIKAVVDTPHGLTDEFVIDGR